MSTESTRDICPAPMPTVDWSRASTMAFDLTRAATAHANSRSRHSSAVGSRDETTFISSRVSVTSSRSWISAPPSMIRTSSAGPDRTGTATTRRFSFLRNASSASSSKLGDNTTSVNTSAMAVEAAPSTGTLNETTPP